MARRIVVASSTKRRQAAWGQDAIESRIVAIGAQSSIGVTAVGFTFTERVTIARIRGSAYAHMDAAAALDSGVLGVGLIVVKNEAFAVGGVASMPSPLSDIEQSWLWHHLFPMGPAVTATDDGGDMSRNARIEIDSKAQRKVQAGDTVAFVWEGTNTSGSPTFDGLAVCRLMALLS